MDRPCHQEGERLSFKEDTPLDNGGLVQSGADPNYMAVHC